MLLFQDCIVLIMFVVCNSVLMRKQDSYLDGSFVPVLCAVCPITAYCPVLFAQRLIRNCKMSVESPLMAVVDWKGI